MPLETEVILQILTDRISLMSEVQAIGISGSKAPLPKAGEGDIDAFIYCDSIPQGEKRQDVLHQLGDLLKEGKINAIEGGHWGVGDFVRINGVETWLLYFTMEETLRDVKSILNGDDPDKLDNYYYPIGRCAMLKTINVLYDKNGFLSSLKNKLSVYPDTLAKTLTQYHLDALEDTEDLLRAVHRNDVLFYHFAMDLALDHFLQALFALNKTFFPSRKRTLKFIEDFELKPVRCTQRLLEVIRLGGCEQSVNQSYALWKKLVEELKRMA